MANKLSRLEWTLHADSVVKKDKAETILPQTLSI